MVDHQEGGTPAYAAAHQGHLKVVDYLAQECRADLTQPTEVGPRPVAHENRVGE